VSRSWHQVVGAATHKTWRKQSKQDISGKKQKLKIDPKDMQDYDFSIDVYRIDDDVLILVDVPLMLNALNHSFYLYTRKV
jgi:hypothetical protein